MKTRDQQHRAQSFERFNPYAADAIERDSDVLAMLAIAFELGQLRYQIVMGQPQERTIEAA